MQHSWSSEFSFLFFFLFPPIIIVSIVIVGITSTILRFYLISFMKLLISTRRFYILLIPLPMAPEEAGNEQAAAGTELLAGLKPCNMIHVR